MKGKKVFTAIRHTLNSQKSKGIIGQSTDKLDLSKKAHDLTKNSFDTYTII